ncbi:MAG: peptidylprolyl isomerase [Methylobacillus sp.]|jgi:peptidyl-prolyl cis-trans isomerase C|nr:peptidylprolyl isomerase [Methylobacillus sp.]
MNKTYQLLLAAALSLSATVAVAAAGNVATVNGKPVKQSLMDYLVKDATARGQQVDDNVRKQIKDNLIGSEIVAQEAQKQGLDKQPDYLAKEELARRAMLVNTYVENFVKKNPVSEADMKAEYDKFKQQMGDKEYHARHILVGTEAEAKDIIDQLNKGGDFAKLAKEKSLDNSKDKGGDLDWFNPATMVKPFSDAVIKLQKGQITATPVQTQFGWHVIKLEESRPFQVPAYDQIKENIKRQLQQVALEKHLRGLREKAKITE